MKWRKKRERDKEYGCEGARQERERVKRGRKDEREEQCSLSDDREEIVRGHQRNHTRNETRNRKETE